MPSRVGGSWSASAVAVLVRPHLWPTAIGVLLRLARPGWYRRWPLLPVPDRAYWRFRALTAYGDERAAPRPDDTVTYLEWCRAWAVGRRR